MRIFNRSKWMTLFAVFALLAAACGDDDTSDETTAETTAEADAATVATEAPLPGEGVSVALVYDIGGRGDQSFNDSAYAGVERAANELGISFTEASPNEDGSNRAELLQRIPV